MQYPFRLHGLVARGEVGRVRELLESGAEAEINKRDQRRLTPLMLALESARAGADLVRLLLERGANVRQDPVVGLCLQAGDPAKLAVLLEYGADLHYQEGDGYGALFDAATGRDALSNPRLVDLLRMLLERGVKCNGVTSYGESALGVLSRVGRFDAVGLLLDAGSDETPLGWTPLIRAVALGTLADVKSVIDSGADLEARDGWSRTAYLVVVQTGDVGKARMLLDAGADRRARGHCETPALFYAIRNHRNRMLRWLLSQGEHIEDTADRCTTTLMAAAECGNAGAVDILLKAGTDVNREVEIGQRAMCSADCAPVIRLLLQAGARTEDLSQEGRRALLGLQPEADEALLDVSIDDFQKGWARRFGVSNPEKMAEPFWHAMIRSGVSASRAARLFGRVNNEEGMKQSPVWCAERLGQSLTVLADGRMVQIGGRHEDSYDSDYCVYNDVILHEADGTVQIFGYPEEVFPPTTAHSATVMGGRIYIVGTADCFGNWPRGMTPVYCLDTTSFRIERMETAGVGPGRISGHRAMRVTDREIQICAGRVVARVGETDAWISNDRVFCLDIRSLAWREVT